MDLKHILTDELTDMREIARLNKDFKTSDLIRDELDSRGSFCMDTPNGQVVYHMGEGYTREYMIKNIRDIDQKFKR